MQNTSQFDGIISHACSQISGNVDVSNRILGHASHAMGKGWALPGEASASAPTSAAFLPQAGRKLRFSRSPCRRPQPRPCCQQAEEWWLPAQALLAESPIPSGPPVKGLRGLKPLGRAALWQPPCFKALLQRCVPAAMTAVCNSPARNTAEVASRDLAQTPR